MRTYAPAEVDAVLAGLLSEPSMARGVVHHAVLPPRPAAFGDVPVLARSTDRGRTGGARHRTAVHPPGGGDRGRSRRRGPRGGDPDRVGQDAVLRAAHPAGPRGRPGFAGAPPVPDQGARPGPGRPSSASCRGRPVCTSPRRPTTGTRRRRSGRPSGARARSWRPTRTCSSSAILPHHTKWFLLFEQLRYIVIDELHTYRGVFGGHVANVLRRLLRICAHYGSHPVIVCCSATIGNPGELASALIGRPVRVIDRAGSPAGERHLVLVDPPVLDPSSGARGSALTLAQRWALPFLRAGRQTIVFGRSRVAVELLLTGLRESLRESRGPRSRVRGYRGGYLPTERRSIERGLRDGEILGVVATNALELGVDIGRLDVSIVAGYPGSIAATWQQFGRAGRRAGTSVAVLVASGAPVDQYVVHHPEFLLEGTPEEARADPDNLHVLLAHLRAATFELPFEPGEVFGPAPADDLLAFLAEEGHVRQAGDGRWYWSSENFPASEISLRTAAPENVVIIDTSPDRPRVLGEVDLFSAQVLVHQHAIYIHESIQYHVDELDWGERKAYVHKIDVDHYTYANRAVTLKPLDVFAEAPATGGRRIHGEVMVASLVTLYKKLKFLTDENVGWGPIDLPELELQTTAYWLTAEGVTGRWRRDELDVALPGAGRAIQTVASVLLMVDPRDLGLVSQIRSPHHEAPTIYLYEAVPGGVGLSERLWDRHDELLAGAAELIAACDCEAGCPACTGPRLEPHVDAKALSLRLLADLGAPVALATA